MSHYTCLRRLSCFNSYSLLVHLVISLADSIVKAPAVLQAPLFGMLSWVNSSEVRRWLQTKIADPQTLRCTSAPQDKAFGNPISRHDSDTHLTGAQDGMPGMPLPSHHPDMAWVSMPASAACTQSLGL